MALSLDLQQRLIAHVHAKWGEEKPCPMCGHPDWVVAGHVNLGVTDSPHTSVFTHGLPCAAVTCRDCGYVALINLAVAKLVVADG